MLGLGISLVRGGFSLLTYIKDGLKLFMPYKKGDGALQFVGTGSTSFDGSNDYVSVPTSSDWLIGSSDYTVGLWVKSTDSQGELISAFNSGGPYHGWLFGIGFGSADGKLYFYQANADDSETKVSTNTVNNGSWRYVSFTKSGTSLKFYIDAVLDSTHTLSYVSTNSGQAILFGQDNNISPARRLLGSLKNIAIWNRALTATEVQNVMYKTYYEVSGRLASGLVSWWSLETSSTDNPAG